MLSRYLIFSFLFFLFLAIYYFFFLSHLESILRILTFIILEKKEIPSLVIVFRTFIFSDNNIDSSLQSTFGASFIYKNIHKDGHQILRSWNKTLCGRGFEWEYANYVLCLSVIYRIFFFAAAYRNARDIILYSLVSQRQEDVKHLKEYNTNIP